MNWYKFHAYNSQALYGFGSADDASLFCDKLNKAREINHYAAKRLDAHDVWGWGSRKVQRASTSRTSWPTRSRDD